MPSFLFYYRSKWTQSTQSINLNFSPFSTPLLGAFWFYVLLKIKNETFTQRCLPGNLGSKSKCLFDKTSVHFGRGEEGAGVVWGGRSSRHWDKRGPGLKKIFLRPCRSMFGQKIKGGVGPSPGSATDNTQFKVTLLKECTFNREVAFLGPSPQTNCSRATVWGCSSKRFGSTPTSFTTVTNSSWRHLMRRSLGTWS